MENINPNANSKSEEVFELVSLILNEQFSKEISDIGRDLLYNGASTIPEIQSRVRTSFENIRNVLIVLLQNKLANVVEVTRRETKIIGYEINIENTLNILMFPKLLIYAKNKFGEQGVMIFEEFMHFGILNASQVFDQVKNKIEKSGKICTQHSLNKVKLTFINMLEKGLIAQTKKLDEFAAARNSIVFTKKTKAQKEKEKIKKEKEEKKAQAKLEKEKLKASKKSTKKKEIKESKEAEESKMEKEILAAPANNKKPPQPTTDEEVALDNPLLQNKETGTIFYFFFNYPQIITEFKCQMVVDFITQKLSPQAGLIASHLLEKNALNSFQKGRTEAISFMGIVEKLSSIKLNEIEDIVAEPNNFLTRVTSDSITLNLANISQYIQERTIEKIIEQQYSMNHVRIYRLLLLCGALDAKNIMDICLFVPKNCNMILNQLYSEGYLETQLVNATGGSSNIMFYSVNFKRNLTKVLDMTYKIIKNLKKYLSEELENIKNRVSPLMQEQYITKVYSAINQLYETAIVLKHF